MPLSLHYLANWRQLRNAPEFIDKKAQSTLILAMKEQGYIVLDDNDKLVDSSTLGLLKSSVSNLVDIEVLQSIIR